MGLRASTLPAGDTQESSAMHEVPEDNGLIFFGQVLPVEMCEEIFLNVPVIDLIKSVTRVCKNWHYLLTDRNFWFRKVKKEGFKLSVAAEEKLTEEEDVSKALHVLQGISGSILPFNSNLILNPSGGDGLKHWQVHHGGDGLRVECPPIGSNSIPDGAGLPTQHCFVSSYASCSRSQTIGLKDLGIEPWMMDFLMPEIRVSEWVSARWDCDAKSETTVELSGTEMSSVDVMNWSSRNDNVVNSEWYQMNKVIADYPAGLTTVTFTNVSRDEQFWAGHYGAKTAGSSVMLHL